MKTLLLATRNANKVAELRSLLTDMDVELVSAADFPDVPDAEEDGDTFAENARRKACHYARLTGHLSLADDSGLVVDALDGRPGVMSSRYAPTDEERIARLLKEMKGMPDKKRAARFICAMALAGPGGEMARTEGRVEGVIARAPAGTDGFGYDPVFFVPDLGSTFAEIPREQKNEISHRGKALREMLLILQRTLARKTPAS